MLTSLIALVKQPLEFVGLISNGTEITEEERELLRRLQEKLKNEVSAFEEHKGFVTQLSNNAIQLDGRWEYKLDITDRFSVGEQVSFKVYKTRNNYVVKDVVLVTEKKHYVSKTVAGCISKVDGNQFDTNTGVVFDLSKVRSDFLPHLHDYVILEGDYPKDKDDSGAFDLDYSFLVVKRVIPAKTKLVTGVITSFNPSSMTGLIGNDILFHQNVCDKFVPKVGDQIVGNVIEGKYDGNFSWRVENMSLNELKTQNSTRFFVVAHIPKFRVILGETKIVEISLSNHGKFPCRIINVKAYSGRNQNVFPNFENERMILPQTTLTWPVEVIGGEIGTHTVKLEWVLSSKSKKNGNSIYSTFKYETVAQDLGLDPGHTGTVNAVRPQLFIPGQSKIRTPKFRKIPMKEYMVPEVLRQLVEGEANYNGLIEMQLALQREKPSLAEGLNCSNYDDWMHTLLFLEELASEQSYKKLAKQDYLYLIRGCVVFSFPAESDYSNIVCGDSLIVSKPWETSVAYEGRIWEVSPSQIFCRFNPEFEQSLRQGALYNLAFKMNRTPYKKRHQAIDLVLKNIGADWLFPSVSLDKESETEVNALGDGSLHFINHRLNNEQKIAVRNILAKKNLPLPYIVYGPPGTGKTMTVLELILQVYVREPNCRILVGAPTNSAVDTLGTRLLEFKTPDQSNILDKKDMVRLTSYNSYRQGSVAAQLMDISFVPNIGDPASDTPFSNDEDKTPTMYLSDLGNHKITIGTLTTLSILNSVGLGKGFFTHVIIDEAGQCYEPETLLPIALVDPQSTQLVLAGDPKQLGPKINSRLAQMYQFDRSFLDRFTSTFVYKKKVDAFEATYGFNPRLITRLVYNYRSLPKIVDLIGGLCYEGDLLPVLSINESREAKVLKKIEILGYNLGSTMDSLIFINVDSKEEQIEGNFSWYNSGEVVQVLNVLNSLYEKEISPDDIGVITPYSLQVRKIYELLDSLKIVSPKVASVEEFQGQERDIIILSLVRNNLGISKKLSSFVTDSQRINVALSRARLLNVIIGNRNTLAVHPMWINIISKCRVINFMGVNSDITSR